MPSYTTNDAMRSGLAAQLNFMNELTRRTVDSVRKLSELNINFTQQLMHDWAEASRKMMGCSDPVQLFGVGIAAAQPAAALLRHYQQQLAGLLSGSELDLLRRAAPAVQHTGGIGYGAAQEVARNMAQARDNLAAAGGPDDRSGADSYSGNGHAAPR